MVQGLLRCFWFGAAAVVLAGCVSSAPREADSDVTTDAGGDGAVSLVPADGVVVVYAGRGDLERYEPPQERGEHNRLNPRDPRLVPLITGISSSGLSTYTGTERSPVPIGEIVAAGEDEQMTLYVVLASDDEGFITRSRLAWSGDFIPGVTVGARMYGRRMGGKGETGRMTAELQIGLPGRREIAFVFVGYEALGVEKSQMGGGIGTQLFNAAIAWAMESRVQWTACRGESQVCYTETIYHAISSVARGFRTCIHTTYADLRAGVLCRDFAAERCYEETI